MKTQKELIHYFVSVAKTGGHPCASTGERACHKLAEAMREIDDDLMLIDSDAAQGAIALLLSATGPFSSTTEKNAVYELISEAGSPCRACAGSKRLQY